MQTNPSLYRQLGAVLLGALAGALVQLAKSGGANAWAALVVVVLASWSIAWLALEEWNDPSSKDD